MGYGASARRVPAKGGAVLTDVDIYKVLLIGQTERGIIDASGHPLLMEEIYSMSDFYPKCGGFNNDYYAGYVAQSFFDELDKSISCEMKVMSWVAADSAQAGYEMMDTASSAVKVFDVKAGRKGLVDKSAFGNKIAIKLSIEEDITMKITSEILTGATSAVLDSVDNISVGDTIKFIDTVAPLTAYVLVTGVTASTKTITFAALTLASTLPVATTTAYRQDVRLEVAVKDDSGNYQKQEEWQFPFVKSNTLGLAYEINNSVTGSNFIYLVVNSSNTSTVDDSIPAELTSWTALTGGSDGTAAIDANWKTLVETYCESAEFAFLLSPESSSITHNVNMLDFCTDDYKGMFMAQSSNGATKETLTNFGASLRGSIKFGMLPSDKWIRVEDPTVTNGTLDIPKVGMDTAHWFNTYAKFGESKVAAGNKSEMVLRTNPTLLGSNGLVHDDRAGVGDRLIRKYSVNICKYTRGKGITNNSARTFSTDVGYMYQNQIMQFILYARSIVAYLREIEQDKSGAVAQEQHYNAVWGYMKKKYDAGHLYIGKREDGTATTFQDVCIIVNDFSINTLANIANGIEEIFLQFVAVPPIESPVLSLASAGVTSVKS